MRPENAQKIYSALRPLVEQAGQHLLGSFETLTEGDVEHKGVVDLVTRLDREAQEILRDGLERLFPNEAIWAEEGDSNRPEEDLVWLVDPLDGTTNFVHGVPFFAVSVARARQGQVECGMVFAPYMREFFWAAAGCGAELNGQPIRVGGRQTLKDSLVATGFPYDIRTNPHNNLRQFNHLAVRTRGLRRCGAASLDLAYVAAGRFDAYWEYRLQPWDLAAGSLLVQEAGGKVTTDSGADDFLWRGDVVAANPLLLPQLLEELQRVELE